MIIFWLVLAALLVPVIYGLVRHQLYLIRVNRRLRSLSRLRNNHTGIRHHTPR